jgi:Ser/Thr protein kinase RdoA (MazF antagonist)
MLQDPPEVDAAAAVGILRDRYRIDAEVRPLRSERDRNFLAVEHVDYFLAAFGSAVAA